MLDEKGRFDKPTTEEPKTPVFYLFNVDGDFRPTSLALGVMIHASRLGRDPVFHELEELASLAGWSDRTMRDRIKDLVDLGYLADRGRERPAGSKFPRRTRTYLLKLPVEELMAHYYWISVPQEHADRPWTQVKVIGFIWRYYDHTGCVELTAEKLSRFLKMPKEVAKRTLRELREEGVIERTERVNRRWKYRLVGAPPRLPKELEYQEPKETFATFPRKQFFRCKEEESSSNKLDQEREQKPHIPQQARSAEMCGFSGSASRRKKAPRKETTGPDLADVQPADLENGLSVRDLHWQAVERGWAEDTPESLNRVKAIARVARSKRNPGGYFRSLLENGWKPLPPARTGERPSRPARPRGLGHIEVGELYNAEKIEQLFERAVDAGMVVRCEADRQKVYSAAVHAVNQGLDPPALFVAILKSGFELESEDEVFDPITCEDEEDGIEMMKEASRKQFRPTSEVAELAEEIAITPDHIAQREDERELAARRARIVEALRGVN